MSRQSRRPTRAEQEAIERRLTKGFEASAVEPGELAPEPPAILFKSYRYDILHGVDPVSGSRMTTMVFTSGNNGLQVIIPVPPLNLPLVIRELQRGLLSTSEDGVPSVDDLLAAGGVELGENGDREAEGDAA